MAFAEHEVLIRRDAMAVYGFLADGMNLPLWRDGVRSVTLLHGSAGTVGAVFRQMVAGRAGLRLPAELEFTHARPGAEIQFRVTFGPGHRSGGFYLSTESAGTRVRFALEAHPEGSFGFLDRLSFLNRLLQRSLRADVAQLERLKDIMEVQQAA